MKIRFTKLPTTDGTIKVSLDGGNSFKDYNVADVHESGIPLADSQDYEKIQIQAPANILKNLNVVSGVKVDDGSGSSSVDEQEIYTKSFDIMGDYGNLYVHVNKIFYSDREPDLYIFYNGNYYSFGYNNQPLMRADISDYDVGGNYIKLNDEIIHVGNTFHISDGQLSDSSSVDPEGLVNILTYEKGVGGTASINGIEVNYVTRSSNISDDGEDQSYYYWDSPSISDLGYSYLYRTDSGYKTQNEMEVELRDSLLSNGPIDVYAKMEDEQYYKLPIKLS